MATDRASSYLTYLPALFHEDAFVGRFLLAFERMLSGFGELVPSAELVKQLENIHTQFVNIRRQFVATHTQLTTITPQISVIAAQVAELRPELEHQLRRQLTTLEQQLTALKRQVDAVPVQLTTLRIRLEQPLREQLADARQQLDGLRERVAYVLENETKLLGRVEELRSRLVPIPLQLEEHRKQLREVLLQLALIPEHTQSSLAPQRVRLQSKLTTIRTHLEQDLAGQLQELRMQVSGLDVQTKLFDFVVRLDEICFDLLRSSDTVPQRQYYDYILSYVESTLVQVEYLRTYLEQSVPAELAVIARQLQARPPDPATQSLRDQLAELHKQLETIRSELVLLTDQLLTLPAQTATERAEHEQALSQKLIGIRRQLTTVDPQLIAVVPQLPQLLETLGSLTEQLVTLPSQLSTVGAQLDKTQFSVQRDQIRTTLDRYSTLLDEISGHLVQPPAKQLVVVPYSLASIVEQLENPRARLETLRSQMVTTRTQIGEFSAQPQLLAPDQQLEAVGEQLETLRRRLLALPQQPEQFGTHVHELHVQLSEKVTKLEELRGHIVRLSEQPDLTDLGPQMTRLHAQLAEMLQPLSTLTPQPAEIDPQLVDIRTKISELGKRPALAGLRQRLEEAHAQLTESLAHVNSLPAQLEERRRQLEQPLRVRLDDVQRQLLNTSSQLEAACSKLAVIAAQLRLSEFSEQLNRLGMSLAGFSTEPLTPLGEHVSVAAFHAHLIDLDSQIDQICTQLAIHYERIATIGVQPGLEDILDRIHTYFIPGPLPATGRAPADFLPWLASWVALSIREDWEEEAKRRFISRIVSLYKYRGTKYGLEQMLETYTGEDAVIYEFDHLPHYFQVEITLSEPTAAGVRRKEQIARAIIDQEKPAHTFYALRILVPTMQIMNDNLERGIRVGHSTLLGTTVRKGSA